MPAKLEILEQPDLPIAKQAAIAVDGIHHRLFRSMLTLGVVVLAVAFLANVLAENSIAGACKRGVRAMAAEHRELGNVAGFVDTEIVPRELARRLAELPSDSWLPFAFSEWLGFAGRDLGPIRKDCSDLLRYDAWFDGLAPGHRRILAGKLGRDEIFARLGKAEDRAKFEKDALSIPLRLPDGLMGFAGRRVEFLGKLSASAARLAEARKRLLSETGSLSFGEWLASAEPVAASATLSECGLKIDEARLNVLRQRAIDRKEERRLLESLRDPALAGSWRSEFGKVFEQEAALSALAEDPARAAWFAAQSAAKAASLDASSAAAAAERLTDARELMDVDENLAINYGARGGLDPRMLWLLVVSFLVCIAGITNAMLISVIERFREIATMKCLGAMNGFIARLFLMESAFLGLVGGILGVLLGGAIGVGRMAASYGYWVWMFFPWADLGASAGIAVVCGLALTTLSALYPAFSAARMLPMEALRVE